MSVRQYIGARYVTKIYENSSDPASAEWEGGRAYEPLALVTYLNSSYLSKKEVPASVGDPASNPTYWVITGAYNGQIAYLQSEIDAINAILPSLATAHTRMIMVSDSYGNRVDSDGHTFFYNIQHTMGIADDDFYHVNSAGAGFVHPTPSNTFLAILQTLTVADPDTITDVCIIGGANDYDKPAADVYNAIGTFCSYVYATYPKAKITLFGCGLTLDATGWGVWTNGARASYKAISDFDGRYINNSEYLLFDSSLLEADFCHPNAAGISAISTAFVQGYKTGSIDVYYNIVNPTMSSSNGSVTAQFSMSCHNGLCKTTGLNGTFYDMTLNFTGFSCSAGDLIANLTLDRYMCPGDLNNGVYKTFTAIGYDENNNMYPIGVMIRGSVVSLYAGLAIPSIYSLTVSHLYDISL